MWLFLVRIGLLTQCREVHLNLSKSNIGDLIEQKVRIRLVLNIKEKLAVFDAEVQSLLLSLLCVNPESDGHVGVEAHDWVVLLYPEVVDGFHLILDINWFIRSEFGYEARTIWLLVNLLSLMNLRLRWRSFANNSFLFLLTLFSSTRARKHISRLN